MYVSNTSPSEFAQAIEINGTLIKVANTWSVKTVSFEAIMILRDCVSFNSTLGEIKSGEQIGGGVSAKMTVNAQIMTCDTSPASEVEIVNIDYKHLKSEGGIQIDLAKEFEADYPRLCQINSFRLRLIVDKTKNIPESYNDYVEITDGELSISKKVAFPMEFLVEANTEAGVAVYKSYRVYGPEIKKAKTS